jgi:hypothetical protein
MPRTNTGSVNNNGSRGLGASGRMSYFTKGAAERGGEVRVRGRVVRVRPVAGGCRWLPVVAGGCRWLPVVPGSLGPDFTQPI